MMERLMSRGERLARGAQRRQVRQVAERLRGMLPRAGVEERETEVLVGGPGIIRRWLVDPSLRFLGGAVK